MGSAVEIAHTPQGGVAEASSEALPRRAGTGPPTGPGSTDVYYLTPSRSHHRTIPTVHAPVGPTARRIHIPPVAVGFTGPPSGGGTRARSPVWPGTPPIGFGTPWLDPCGGPVPPRFRASGRLWLDHNGGPSGGLAPTKHRWSQPVIQPEIATGLPSTAFWRLPRYSPAPSPPIPRLSGPRWAGFPAS